MNEPPINLDVPPSGPGCVECEETGKWWLHLRRCATCGHVGCCDSSLMKHATAHWEATSHPLVQSFEPGEDWFYDYRTGEMSNGPELAAPDSHPLDQTVPGPASLVPRNWEAQLTAQSQSN